MRLFGNGTQEGGYFSTKKEGYQFQETYVSYMKFEKNAIKDQVDKCLSSQFDIKISQQII